jgi:acyl carrier protein|tara:strand:- start:412 stop:651 length:240 start_codon:yes stop_codon:yes gene_type:complete
MILADLAGLLEKQFPDADIPESFLGLSMGSFPDWDSLGHISLLLSIEEHYGIRFSLEEMESLSNMQNIASALKSHGVGS